MNQAVQAPGPAITQTGNVCGCGKPVRYVGANGDGACNKYMRCPDYDTLREQFDAHRTLLSALATKFDQAPAGTCLLCGTARSIVRTEGGREYVSDCVNTTCLSHKIAQLMPWLRAETGEKYRQLLESTAIPHKPHVHPIQEIMDEEDGKIFSELGIGPVPLNSDVSLAPDTARALHRVVRALHDGNCPKCGALNPSDTVYDTAVYEGWCCPDCKFTITAEEAKAAMAAFRPFMEANLAIFEAWRASLPKATT